MKSPSPFLFEAFGIKSWHGHTPPMDAIHSHTEIELSFVEGGDRHYIFGSTQHIFKKDRFYAFSGIQPHQLVYSEPDSCLSCLTIPMPYFMGWQLPEALSDRILHGEIVEDDTPEECSMDPIRFRRWRHYLEGRDPRYLRVILLEVHARLERLALNKEITHSKPRAANQQWSNPVARMTAHILQNLTDPHLTLKGIAESANLNSSYASTLFSRKTGESPVIFLTRQRLAYARFILATTDATVLDAALSSGFGSSSQFYSCFKKHFGGTPSDLRTR